MFFSRGGRRSRHFLFHAVMGSSFSAFYVDTLPCRGTKTGPSPGQLADPQPDTCVLSNREGSSLFVQLRKLTFPTFFGLTPAIFTDAPNSSTLSYPFFVLVLMGLLPLPESFLFVIRGFRQTCDFSHFQMSPPLASDRSLGLCFPSFLRSERQLFVLIFLCPFPATSCVASPSCEC